MNLKAKIVLSYSILAYLFGISIFAQVVYEPLHRGVYKFLDRVSQKGLVDVNDEIKPISRKYITEGLIKLKSQLKFFTPLEKEEYEFYKKEFGTEIGALVRGAEVLGEETDLKFEELESNKYKPNFISKDKFGRYRLFSYADDLFKVNFSPILGYDIGSRDGEKLTHSWNGIYFYGYLGDKIGFSFDFRDNRESGLKADKKKSFTPETGNLVTHDKGNSFDYSEIHTTLATDWAWGSFAVGKDFLEWGYGESGKLVLSNKAPSFPFVRLDLWPATWLRFNYIHGWLSSDVIDSNEIYASLRNGDNRILYREKYLASHTITLYPISGLSLSFGESIIYSDRLEISYLMPLMFFRLADHYLSNANNNAGDNSQFFFGISSRNHLLNTHLYGSLFIDEIAVGDLFNAERERNQFGFSLGGSVVDLPINNLTLTLEFTKIYPFVYRHYIQTQTYENQSYTMGHWMGHNADLIYASMNYRFIRGLQATLWGQYIRKGEDGTVDQQYTRPSQPFLFGLRSNYSYLGAEIKYEITHELFARAKYLYRKISKEQNDGSFLDNDFSEFGVAVYYGM